MKARTTNRLGKMAVVLTVVAGTWDLAADAQKYEVYETYPGSSFRDWRKPATVYEWTDDSRLEVYETRPGSSFRDRRTTATVFEWQSNGDIEIYETHPGSSFRDWRKPSTVIRESDW